MPHPAPHTFDQVWTHFLHHLRVYSPASAATLQPGATAEQIAHLEAVQGFALHPDVRALLEHHNGTVYVDGNAAEGAEFLPLGYMLDPIDQILAGHEWRTTFSAENRALGLGEDTLYGHAHQWVPIAHSIDAGILFVEHRPGPTYGHVIELGIGSGAFEGTLWADTLLEFFDALTYSLDTRTPFDDWIPGVRESDLTGKFVMHWTFPPVPPVDDNARQRLINLYGSHPMDIPNGLRLSHITCPECQQQVHIETNRSGGARYLQVHNHPGDGHVCPASNCGITDSQIDRH